MIEAAGVAWYTPETWRRLQAVAGDVLCGYDEYLRRTEQLMRGFEVQGIKAKKVAVDVDHLLAWCKAHGFSISDSRTRSASGATLVAHGGKPFDINLPVEGADFLRSQ